MKPRKSKTTARRETLLRRNLTAEEYKALSAPGSAELGKEPMTKAHRLKARKSSGLAKGVPLNFLLGCSEHSLGNFILARYAEASDLRRELLAIIDRLTEQMMLARLGEWFRDTDRNVIKTAVENPIDVTAWAAEQIRNQGRSEEEIGEDGYLIPLPSLPPGAAHLAAALRYQERNIAEGKCAVCPKPQAHHSVRYCEEHLAAARERHHRKKGLSLPGSREYLYAGETPSTHGIQPGTLAALAMAREKKSREVLARLGLKPESAAVSLKAAKEALLRVMPDSKAKAMTSYDLFQAAQIPTTIGRRSWTGYEALRELLKAGAIKRIGKARKGHPFRYFLRGEDVTGPQLDTLQRPARARPIHIPENLTKKKGND